MPTLTPLEFVFAWLSDEQLREQVLFKEDDTMGAVLGDPRFAAIFESLDEGNIADLLKSTSGLNDAAVEKLFATLKQAGFHAPTLYDEIYNKLHGCAPVQAMGPAPTPDDKLKAAKAAVYSQGFIHLRDLYPKKVTTGIKVIELRGQGFPPKPAVQFVQVTNPTVVVPGAIVRRRADVDVHQYLYVEADFVDEGDYRIEMRDTEVESPDWTGFACSLSVVP
jgi:hypothetical protein